MADDQIHQLICAEGYRLVDIDEPNARRTYLHGDNADREQLSALSHALRYAGWRPDAAVPPVYRLPGTTQLIEIEPAGADCSGHYLHWLERAAD